MRHPAVSVLSNIAEGFERETDAEFVRSLYIAKGSCGELSAQALLAWDQKFISKEEREAIRSQCRKISAGLFNLIAYLRHNRTSCTKERS